MVILQAVRLIVRTTEETDYPVVCELFSDPEAMRFIGPRRSMSHAESYDWLRNELGRQTLEITRYAVALKPGTELIGFAEIQRVDGVYDFGYYFRRPFWGKGYTIGPLRIPTLFESMAVPEIRGQTDELTRLLTRDHRAV